MLYLILICLFVALGFFHKFDHSTFTERRAVRRVKQNFSKQRAIRRANHMT